MKVQFSLYVIIKYQNYCYTTILSSSFLKFKTSSRESHHTSTAGLRNCCRVDNSMEDSPTRAWLPYFPFKLFKVVHTLHSCSNACSLYNLVSRHHCLPLFLSYKGNILFYSIQVLGRSYGKPILPLSITGELPFSYFCIFLTHSNCIKLYMLWPLGPLTRRQSLMISMFSQDHVLPHFVLGSRQLVDLYVLYLSFSLKVMRWVTVTLHYALHCILRNILWNRK